jgi:flagellar biogenesis protein FliO
MPSTSRHLVVLFLVAGLGQAMAQGQSSAGNPEAQNDRPSFTLGAAEREQGSVRPGLGESRQAAESGADSGAVRQAGLLVPEGSEKARPAPERITQDAGDPRAQSPGGPAVDTRSSSPSGRNGPISLPPTSRTGRASTPSAELSKSGWRGVATLGGSLAVVLGLFFVVAWVMRRTASGTPALLPSEVVEVLGRAALAGRQQVHLIRLGAKLVLVSVSPTGIETLSEVTEADEVQRLVGLCRRNHASSATAVFRRVFEQFSGEPGRSARWTDGPSAARPSQGARSGYSDNLREETDG